MRDNVKCNFCPFIEYQFNIGTCEGHGEKYRIMIINMQPGFYRDKSEKQIYSLLSEVGIKEKEIYLTYLCKSIIPKGIKMTPEQEKHCLSHINKEIVTVKPQLVVLLGAGVRDAFWIRYPETVTSKTFKDGDLSHKTKIYPIQNPATLYYSPELKDNYIKTLTKIHRYYKPILI